MAASKKSPRTYNNIIREQPPPRAPVNQRREYTDRRAISLTEAADVADYVSRSNHYEPCGGGRRIIRKSIEGD